MVALTDFGQHTWQGGGGIGTGSGNHYYLPSPSGTLGIPGMVNYFLTNTITIDHPPPGTLQLEGATDTQEEKLLM